MSAAFLFLSSKNVLAQPPTAGELLRNSGFEGGGGGNRAGAGVPRWEAYESGYDVDRQTHHDGDQCIRCDSTRQNGLRGAQCKVELNQKVAVPIFVSGWSKADQVSGLADDGYSLYVDLIYNDDTPLWGKSVAFSTGTHAWERRQMVIFPQKPVKSMTVYALLRKHSGTVWFDDFSAHPLEGAGIFDSQPLAFPSRAGLTVKGEPVSIQSRNGLSVTFNGSGDLTGLKTNGEKLNGEASGGFYVRDVGADSQILPIRGAIRLNKAKGYTLSSTPGMRLNASIKVAVEGDALSIDGEINDVSKQDRAVTVYFALPVEASGWTWSDDIRRARTIDFKNEYANLTSTNVGATGGISLYPFGCLSNSKTAIGISNQMDMPNVFRIFYSGPTHQFVIAWDFALTQKSGTWPAGNARFRCTLFHLPTGQAEWGFRAAAHRFYQLNSPNFDRLAKAEGLWMPFTDPSKVERPEDFSFAYHEGDNSIKSDDASGILSFRYTEPMSWWMNMPKETPRTYENAISLLNKLANGTPEDKNHELRDMARATLNSGTQDANGRFNLEFREEPWAKGAIFVLNPNPELASTPDKPTKASVSYTVSKGIEMYGEKAKKERGEQDGEYLDSLESWSDTLDFRPSNLQASPYPLTFSTGDRRPVLPQWFSTHTFTRYLRDDLHNRGKLLFANTSPVNFTIFSSLLDVAGIEVNWLGTDGKFNPDSDSVMNLRRTMSSKKPYLLLQNTNYDKFSHDYVEKYLLRSLFYGIYPSMFSANAADHPYWENPTWYNRDRDLFKKYLPTLKRLSSAGWEPVTYARSSRPAISIERYGANHFTVMNTSESALETEIVVDVKKLGLTNLGATTKNSITGETLKSEVQLGKLQISLKLKAGEVGALEIVR